MDVRAPLDPPWGPHREPPAVLADRLDEVATFGAPARWPAAQGGAGCEAGIGVVGADLDDDLAGDAVRLGDPPDYQVHAERYWSVSTTSTRMPRPPMPATSVRNAVAV